MYVSVLTFHNEYVLRHVLRDVHKQHVMVMKFFPSNMGHENPRMTHNILWRKENFQGKTVILIQSDIEPSKTHVKDESLYRNTNLENRDFDTRLDALLKEERLSYKITVNPVKKHGHTIIPLTTREDTSLWWKKRMCDFGLKIIDDDIIVDINNVERGKRGGQALTINSATIVGRATVEDSEKLARAVRNGIGREKAYGYGMLSLSKTYSDTSD